MLSIDQLKRVYTNEQLLVILFTRLYFGTQGIDTLREFLDRETIDWMSFYKLISVNDIRGFVYHIVSESKIDMDASVYSALKKDVMGISLFGAYQADLLRRLKPAFEQLGITVIPYKGRVLAERYYSSPLLREGSDIDFLISKDDLLPLRKYLLENGFMSTYNVSEHQLGFAVRYHRELPFKSPKDRMGISCSVELQWKLLGSYFGPFPQYDFFIQHLQPYTTADGATQMGLAPTYDFLCVASNHLIKEALARFKYVIDLAAIIHTSSGQMDWGEINRQFKQHRFSNFLWSGLRALEDIVGLQFPIPDIPAVPYHLFAATELRSGKALYLALIKQTNLTRSLAGRIKFSLRAYWYWLLPNYKDLEATKGPAWAIPFLIPVKSLKFIYTYLTK
ncbi:nucleotidyltransferase family protein [Chitinophaga varians]|uniref:nucleotidyltransferase family protein n=1 Tax=Chitinophaga varians TaxID=2202339 RepID=UPI00165F029B|nr:nucleotidyltransferase family protein [Chitinophaga varians]MBC9909732.1 nucleotidyltransferase family protein [Chitinophaga varians]